MSVIFHASDLHFGRTNPDVANALTHALHDLKPDLAVLSGDFTQTGSEDEFRQARDFIATLPCPFLAVPGNHDISARNLVERFAHPYRRYRHFIHGDLNPVYQDDNVFILGLNTARPALPHWNWANGTVSFSQINEVRQKFSAAKRDQWKILVCHHPLYAMVDTPISTFVWRAGRLRAALRDMGVHLIMTGHIHHTSVAFEETDKKSLYHIGAASAFSTRLRTQGNGYNIIHAQPGRADVTLMTWKDGNFHEQENHVIYR